MLRPSTIVKLLLYMCCVSESYSFSSSGPMTTSFANSPAFGQRGIDGDADSMVYLVRLSSVAPRMTGDTTVDFGKKWDDHDQAASSAFLSPSLPPTSEIAGVIFDMDGTLTKHCIDFADLRRRIYEIADADVGADNHDGGCVLEVAGQLSPDGRAKATKIFKEIELQALRDMSFNDGVADLCHYIDSIGLKRAVLTRNVGSSVDVMHSKLFQQEGVPMFFPAIARDTTSTCEKTGQERLIPAKPAPDAILHICSIWNCQPHQVVMVGDSAADDMVAASRAGCGGRVLLAEGGLLRDTDSGAGGPEDDSEAVEREPTITVSSLLELQEMLRVNNK